MGLAALAATVMEVHPACAGSLLSHGLFRRMDPTKDASSTPVPSHESSSVASFSGWMRMWPQEVLQPLHGQEAEEKPRDQRLQAKDQELVPQMQGPQ